MSANSSVNPSMSGFLRAEIVRNRPRMDLPPIDPSMVPHSTARPKDHQTPCLEIDLTGCKLDPASIKIFETRYERPEMEVTFTGPEPEEEFLVVSDATSEVLLSTFDEGECRTLLTAIGKSGGSATLFKAIE